MDDDEFGPDLHDVGSMDAFGARVIWLTTNTTPGFGSYPDRDFRTAYWSWGETSWPQSSFTITFGGSPPTYSESMVAYRSRRFLTSTSSAQSFTVGEDDSFYDITVKDGTTTISGTYKLWVEQREGGPRLHWFARGMATGQRFLWPSSPSSTPVLVFESLGAGNYNTPSGTYYIIEDPL